MAKGKKTGGSKRRSKNKKTIELRKAIDEVVAELDYQIGVTFAPLARCGSDESRAPSLQLTMSAPQEQASSLGLIAFIAAEPPGEQRPRAGPSQVAKAVFQPAGSHARLVFGGWSHSGRKAFTAPLRAARVLPGARGVDQHPVPQAGAELRNVAILHGRAGVNGRAENPGENHHTAFAGVEPVSERPFNLLIVRGIDVLFHHN